MVERLIANLQNQGPLSAAARDALAGLQGAPKTLPAGAEIASDGDRPQDCTVLVRGHAFRHKNLPDGRRQIISFYIAGDVVDLQGLLLSLDDSVTALTACEVFQASRARMHGLMDDHPQIARAFWRLSLLEGAMFRAWMVGMGRRTAYARVAHLLCEVMVRMRAVGLAENNRANFPVTQAHLSDALGLSMVHTNRTLQALRADGLISFRGHELVIRDWPGLVAAGEFDPAYLHLPGKAR